MSFRITNDSAQLRTLKVKNYLKRYRISSNDLHKFSNILMKLGRNTERDYFKQEMLMNNNNKKNRKVSLAKWLSVRLRTKWLWVRVQLQSLKKMQIYNCLQEGLYWL